MGEKNGEKRRVSCTVQGEKKRKIKRLRPLQPPNGSKEYPVRDRPGKLPNPFFTGGVMAQWGN